MLKRSLDLKYQSEIKTAFNAFVIIYFTISLNFYTLLGHLLRHHGVPVEEQLVSVHQTWYCQPILSEILNLVFTWNPLEQPMLVVGLLFHCCETPKTSFSRGYRESWMS